MNSGELTHLLFRVVTSWQVIFVTVALILYLLLVFYAAKVRRRKRLPANAAAGNSASKASRGAASRGTASKGKSSRGRASKTPSSGMPESGDPGTAERA